MKKNRIQPVTINALFMAMILVCVLAISSCHGVKPIDESPEAIAKGRVLYGKYCAVCHGADGEGYLADQATALSNQDFLVSASDKFILDGILYGRPGTAMSAWAQEKGGPLSHEQVVLILKFIRSWQEEPSVDLSHVTVKGDAENGAVVYRKLCAVCHGKKGEGGKAVQLNNRVFQETASDGFIRYAVENGRRNTQMPEFKKMIREQDIDDVVVFVKTLNTKNAPHASVDVDNKEYEKIIKEKAILNPGNPPANFSLIDDRYVPAADVYAAAYVARQSLIIIDARPTSDYLIANIKGAISIPFYDVEEVVDLLPKNIWIITYCACPHALSGREVDILKKAGFKKVGVLDEGIFYWLNKGYPSEIIASENKQ